MSAEIAAAATESVVSAMRLDFGSAVAVLSPARWANEPDDGPRPPALGRGMRVSIRLGMQHHFQAEGAEWIGRRLLDVANG
jgi:hypothetical protein